MAEDKKDLTNLIQYSKKMLESGQLPPAPKGAVMEDVPIEKIDEFESLEAYAKSNPPPELPPDPPPPDPTAESPPPPSVVSVPAPDAVSSPSESLESASPPPEAAFEPPPEASNEFPTTPETPSEFTPSAETPNEFPSTDFQTNNGDPSPSPDHSFANSSDNSSGNPPASFSGGNDFPVSPPEDSGFATTPAPPSSEFPSSDLSPPTSEAVEPPEEPAITPPPPPEPPPPVIKAEKPPEPTPPPPLPSATLSTATASSSSSKEKNSIENLKKFSDNIPIGKPAVPAAFPFSLLITGALTPEEREKLLDLLSREKMGFREIDLEPQLASGKILIPRISEYAGVLLIQALRGIRAQIRFGPADTIFASKESPTEDDTPAFESGDGNLLRSSDTTHPAEHLPITAAESLPQLPQFQVIDTLTASAILGITAVEIESTSEYQEMVDALQREIKYKAFRKGAQAVVQFKIQLNSLSSPLEYRLMAIGTAIRAGTAPEMHPPASE